MKSKQEMLDAVMQQNADGYEAYMRHRRIAAMRNFDALLDAAEYDEESLFALRDLIKDATDGEWKAVRLSA